MLKINNHHHSQKGSVVAYILAALFLSGVLIMTLSQGSKKSLDSTHIEREVNYIRSDLESIHAAISECLQIYPDHVDLNGDNVIDDSDNPNAPFPVYADLSTGEAGEKLKDIICPAAPASNNRIFAVGYDNRVKLLADTTLYNTTYYNDSTEGIYLKIAILATDDIWQESIARINNAFSKCSVEIIKAAPDCEDGCIYYWISRPSSSVLGSEANCP